MKAWSEMTAREKGALVAEKVMGWTQIFGEGSPIAKIAYDESFKSPVFRVHDGRKNKPPGGYITAIRRGQCDLWSPTTCPKACAEVIEAMRAKGLGFMVQIYSGQLWEARFADRRCFVTGFATADTMPEAVALAALRACGVEV